jgi:hypothetical protein
VDEGQDPGARLAALGHEARRPAPDREEGVLDGVLRKRLVAEHAEREAVRDISVAVVQLGERIVVGTGRERHDRFVREVCEVAPLHRGRTGSRP